MFDLRRREFITLLGGAAAAVVVALARGAVAGENGVYGVASRLAREPLARVRNHDCFTRAVDFRIRRGLLGRKDISAVIALEKANLRQFRPKLGDAADHGHPASTTLARQRAHRGA